jgi:hypothetical protein
LSLEIKEYLVIFKNRFLTLPTVAFAILLLTNVTLSQDYEQTMTDYSEKFLAYSQVFVKFASMNINTQAEYDAALAVSDVAKEFHYHTSYLADFLLILKIIDKHQAEKELAARLLRLRVSNLIKECDEASRRVDRAVKEAEVADLTSAASDVKADLEALRGDLEKISGEYAKEG